MAHDGSGEEWKETDPQDAEFVRDGAKETRDLRIGLRLRLEKEHVEPAAASAGGEHLAGSAKAFRASAAPTLRPDAVTPLDAGDAGRLWIDSDTGYLYVWSGTAWMDLVVPTVELEPGSVTESILADGAVTRDKLGDEAVGTDEIEDGTVTPAKLSGSTGLSYFFSGTYSGATRANVAVTGVGFKPAFVMISWQTKRDTWTVFGDLMIRRTDQNGTPGAGQLNALTFDADGFTVLSGTKPGDWSKTGETYSYVAWT